MWQIIHHDYISYFSFIAYIQQARQIIHTDLPVMKKSLHGALIPVQNSIVHRINIPIIYIINITEQHKYLFQNMIPKVSMGFRSWKILGKITHPYSNHKLIFVEKRSKDNSTFLVYHILLKESRIANHPMLFLLR